MRRVAGAVLSIVALAAMPAGAGAATPGFTEDFNGGDTAGFFSGTDLFWWPSGGVGGSDDGYIEVYREFPGHLGAATADPPYTGNLTADGVTGFSFWLRDTGADDDLEIHVGVGNSLSNFWIYIPGFIPPEDSWAFYTVDFSDPSQWVRTQGSGTFANALATSDRLLFRHDREPFIQQPDAAVGDFGIDRITVLPEPATLLLLSLGGVALRVRWR